MTSQNYIVGLTTSSLLSLGEESFASIIQEFIREPALINAIYATDLTIHLAGNEAPASIVASIELGTLPLDAIIWHCNGKPRDCKTVPLGERPTDIEKATRVSDAKKHLLYLYLYIMIRGQAPLASAQASSSPQPAFLSKVLGFSQPVSFYAEKLASFNMIKLRLDWVKAIKVVDFAPAIRQRLMLGLPGYRSINVFRVFPMRPDADDDAKRAYQWVKNTLCKGYHWDVFPPTRSALIHQYCAPLNKNLGTLILKCFSEEDVQRMVDTKMLFERPSPDPRYELWRTWPLIRELVVKEEISF